MGINILMLKVKQAQVLNGIHGDSQVNSCVYRLQEKFTALKIVTSYI
jgi:hypothetical protein